MSRPEVRGFTHVSLSVRDLDASLAFYRDLLGLGVLADVYDGEAFEGREAMLLAGRTALCLQEHAARREDGFDPTHVGLDHLALAVGSLDDLHAFADHLTAAEVDHSGVMPLPGFGHMIELRDPDNIQIELHALT
jgi:glyoxylase I family protein